MNVIKESPVPPGKYITINIRHEQGLHRIHIPLDRIKCIIINKNNLYLHLTTAFVGPLANNEFIKGGVESIKKSGVKIFYN